MSQTCKQCGANVEAGTTFCTSCGAFMDWGDEKKNPEPVTTQAQPQPVTQPHPTPAPTPTPQPQPVTAGPAQRACPRCGESNEVSRNFCRRCGESLTGGAPAVGATGAAPTAPTPAVSAHQGAPKPPNKNVQLAIAIGVGLAVLAAFIVVPKVLNREAKPASRLTATARPGASPSAGTASGKPTIRFFGPTDGGKVGGPRVQVWLSIENFKLVDAGSPLKRGQGHAHILVDINPATIDKAIPVDAPNVIHLGKAPFDGRVLELSQGPHVLYAVMGDNAHVIVPSIPAAKVEFTVAGPAWQGRGPLPNACAEVASGSGEVRVRFPQHGGLLMGSVNSTCRFKTEGGRCTWADVATHRILGEYDGRTFAGNVTGATARTLESGVRSICGADDTLAVTPYKLNATIDRKGAMTGTLGARQFVVRHDDSGEL